MGQSTQDNQPRPACIVWLGMNAAVKICKLKNKSYSISKENCKSSYYSYLLNKAYCASKWSAKAIPGQTDTNVFQNSVLKVQPWALGSCNFKYKWNKKGL